MAAQLTQTELNHAREAREERRADFWQRQINEGRMQRQADDQMKGGRDPGTEASRPSPKPVGDLRL